MKRINVVILMHYRERENILKYIEDFIEYRIYKYCGYRELYTEYVKLYRYK